MVVRTMCEEECVKRQEKSHTARTPPLDMAHSEHFRCLKVRC